MKYDSNYIFKKYIENKNKGEHVYAQLFEYFHKKYVLRKTDLYNFRLNENELLKKIAKRENFFIPGKFYTFYYRPLYENILDYYDKRPVLFLIKGPYFNKNTKNIIISGVNLNFLPEEIKLFLVDRYFRTFYIEINEEIDSVESKKLKIFFQRILSFLKDINAVKKYFENDNNNFLFAYRRYIISRIYRPILIEYDDLEIIPLLRTKYFVGKTLDEIIKEYNFYKKLK